MDRFFTAALLLLVTLACSDRKPRIDYANQDTTEVTMNDMVRDTSRSLMANLPVRFDSTEHLIYGLRVVDNDEKGSYLRSSSYKSNSDDSYFHNGNTLHGTYVNLIFEDAAGRRTLLTDKKLVITRVHYLREIYRSTGKDYLLYLVRDYDSDGNGSVNTRDLQSMHMSRTDGSEFRKITANMHELQDYRFIAGTDAMYFRTLEDSDKDGNLTDQDSYHHYVVDFTEKGYRVRANNPLDVLG
ncbi:MAG: hypothetical protein WBH03_01915, partial [Cyclobacteriaceae bacterium]